jgi:hypothetical protein
MARKELNILICSSGLKWKSHLEYASYGISKFYKTTTEFKLINMDIVKDVEKYDIIMCCSWYINDAGKLLFKLAKEYNIPVIFLSDGCFFYTRKRHKTVDSYPWAVFINGPQSASWGDKHYRNDLPNNRVSLFSPEINLKPWRIKGDSIIIAHQSGGDHLGNSKQQRYADILKVCVETGRPIIYRLHPNSSSKVMSKIQDKIKGIKHCKIEKASKDRIMNIKNVHCLVTVGGKSPAKSIIQGVPAITTDITIAEMVAEKNLNNINNPRMIDRTAWINWLSYCHWTFDEMNKGLLWKFFLDEHYIILK